MGKIAFVFSGQGAQKSGMGRELFEQVPESAAIFHQLDAIRPGTSTQCFEGTDEELAETCNTQPTLFTVEMAAAAALSAAGIHGDMAAGFSLGELSALTYSGAATLEEGFRLVCQRGKLMQADAETQVSGMAAVIKLNAEQVETLCKNYDHVYPVNFNSPMQTAVAGLKEELDLFNKDVRAAGGRTVPLQVQGGFHSPFMANAAHNFGIALKDYTISIPTIPIYSDYTGKPYAGDLRDLLSKQICNPVRWQGIVERMIADGADTFIELGCGKTLCNLIGKINPDVRKFRVEDFATLQETIEGVKESC